MPKKKKDSNYLKLKKLWKKHNIAIGAGDIQTAKNTGQKIVALQTQMNTGYIADFSHLEEIKI